MRVSLKDLLNAKERGRWWIVGSAWSGKIGDADGAQGKLLWTSVKYKYGFYHLIVVPTFSTSKLWDVNTARALNSTTWGLAMLDQRLNWNDKRLTCAVREARCCVSDSRDDDEEEGCAVTLE